MADSTTPLTAKARLALSRTELLAAMGFEEVESAVEGVLPIRQVPRPEADSMAGRMAHKLSDSAVGQWWQRHPMSSVVELGNPLLRRYAQQHPAKLIVYGAGTGALLWVLKPWRLLSLATVVTLVLKSSDFTGLIARVLPTSSGASTGDRNPPGGV